MPTKLLRQIKNTIPELRKSEKQVANFVLNDPKSVISMKTAEASSAMGISEPTLIRFCKALGFSGYQEFKINLSDITTYKCRIQFDAFTHHQCTFEYPSWANLFSSTLDCICYLQLRKRQRSVV